MVSGNDNDHAAKLAQRIKAEGNDVLICAADTFRAAASDNWQLSERHHGVP